MDVRMPDGTIIKDVPDGMSKADLMTKLKSNGHDVSAMSSATTPAKPAFTEQDAKDAAFKMGIMTSPAAPLAALLGIKKMKDVADLGKGGSLGVADIGNTALKVITSPLSAISPAVAQWNRTRQADFDALTEQNKDSTPFKVGRIGANVAITAPVGGALAGAAKLALPAAMAARGAPILNAIQSAGMRTGLAPAATTAGKAIDMGTRMVGGAVTGGASTALIDPEHAGTGALVGGLMPGAVKIAGTTGNYLSSMAEGASQRLMQSAIKPTIAQLRDGSAKTAIDTLLKYGINPTTGGVNKLRELIGGLNDEIASKIGVSTAKIDKQKVLGALGDVRQKFTKQVSPTGDLNAIQSIADDFTAHPSLPTDAIPVSLAQELKQGTYKVLNKKYGQVGTAETEAQKGLARGLKEEIASAVPEVQGLNAEESRLIDTLKVSERRALMELNKNPGGLSLLAKNPASWAAMMADKSSLFKSLAARVVNASSESPRAAAAMIERGASNPLIRAAAPIIVSER